MVSIQPRVDRFIQIVQSEYREMPGLQLTRHQMQRFLGIDVLTCQMVLEELERQCFLRRTPKDAYVLHS
ncbi:MAG TPA: hypothetical protein VLV86_22050 [Vicinamibacterales bacterium]|nr:hypothetical protein [Vicinamibacterales bacterium]